MNDKELEKIELQASTVYITDKSGEFLLIFHQTFKAWLPPGGKKEPGEALHITAIREVKEETGLCIGLDCKAKKINDTFFTVPVPAIVQLEVVSQCVHENFIYFITLPEEKPKIRTEKGVSYRWVTAEEVSLSHGEYWDDVKQNVQSIASGHWKPSWNVLITNHNEKPTCGECITQ